MVLELFFNLNDSMIGELVWNHHVPVRASREPQASQPHLSSEKNLKKINPTRSCTQEHETTINVPEISIGQ